MTEQRTIDLGLARLPTEEELQMLREAYAETYPVRPLLNEIDRLRDGYRLMVENKHGLIGITARQMAQSILDGKPIR